MQIYKYQFLERIINKKKMKNLALGLLLVATLGTVYYLGLEDEV